MNVLDIKVLRDLKAMWAQVLSISLLAAAGIAVLVMSVSNYLALIAAMETHYRDERFADLFATAKRAPLAIVDRVREIEGMGIVEPRVSHPVRVIRPDTELPISGRVVSLPRGGQPSLNRLHLTAGRWIDPLRPNEVIINAAYAQSRGVEPGETIDVVLNGRLESFRIVGVALSPEFVFATRAALPLPDDRSFVVLWASEDAVASAFDMRGAFNDLLMTLAPGASEPGVIAEIDRILAPHGGIGAHNRLELPSHRFLEDELAEQRTLSIVMPAVFFGIAAFLLNVVIGRLVEAQRGQIASLKALGFPRRSIAIHYVKLVTVISLIGAIIGLALGAWMADLVIESYRMFFRFPVLEAHVEPWLVAAAVLVSVGVANGAAAAAVVRITQLAPADAMRPSTAGFGRAAGWTRRLAGSGLPLQYLIPLRTALGRPLRTAFSILGIALALPLVLFGFFWFDAIDYMIDVSFSRIERGDAVLAFSGDVSVDALSELRSAPGVLAVELQRAVPVRLHAGHRTYRTAAMGIAQDSELRVLRDRELRPIAIPTDGIMMSRPLADRLGLRANDQVVVEVLQGQRPVRTLPVRRISDDLLGFSVTMDLTALNRMMQDGEVANGAALRIDPLQGDALWRHVKAMPRIEASSVKAVWLALFNDTIAAMVLFGAVILAGFGMMIAVGVVYNSARISLQERAWELASLRILGFTRREVTIVLLSELAIEVLIAVPIGLAIARGLIGLITSARASESFQIPPIIEPGSYAVAALLVIAATVASAAVIQRRIDELDLVAVLKTRD